MSTANTTGTGPLRIRRDELRRALIDGFRSGTLPAPADAASRVFAQASAARRANLLETLLRQVGPLALAVLAAGRFAKYMERERWAELSIPLEEIHSVTAGQIAEIARYVEQCDPDFTGRLSSLLAADVGALMALGTGAVVVLMKLVARQRTR